VANALLNAPHVKQQILAQRASVPYQMEMMKTNLDLQHAQVGHYQALAQELRDRGQYYAHGGRPLQSQYKVDDDGNLWMMHGTDPATPVVDADGNHIQARAPQQRTPQGTEAERQVNSENTDRQARGLPAYTATERGRRLTQIHAANAGAAAGAGASAKNATPGNVPQTTELQYKNITSQITETEAELKRLTSMKSQAANAEFGGQGVAPSEAMAKRSARMQALTQQHSALIDQRNKLIPSGNVPPTPNGSSGRGKVPPTPAGTSSPHVTISSDGTIHVQ
jgi:hypothetical protein